MFNICKMLKRSEQSLLNHLRGEQKPEGILSDVRASMGELAYVKGNPLTKTEIKIDVNVTYFQIVGLMIIPPAALPCPRISFSRPGIQLSYPAPVPTLLLP